MLLGVRARMNNMFQHEHGLALQHPCSKVLKLD